MHWYFHVFLELCYRQSRDIQTAPKGTTHHGRQLSTASLFTNDLKHDLDKELPSGTQQTGAAPEPDVEVINNPLRTTRDLWESGSDTKTANDSELKCKDAISIATTFGAGSFLRSMILLPTNTTTRVYAIGTLLVIYLVIFLTAAEMLYLIFQVPPSPRAMKAIKFMVRFHLVLLVVVLFIEFYVHLPDKMLWTVGLACVVVLLSRFVVMSYWKTLLSKQRES
ncbi:uncharacterized protein LOC18443330 isoform X2 [Amborella trichopoda]|uniref:uncharacterized protein LOC18443330 isoform X2 n=1 Tax=Amborella trichopoda TaxID=13333 RepID=UPI0009BFC2FD|nr:uncharacterized protein LOC18443330 isoform X2 [Amborella trichopoda]|eukprot:XP_020528599.1 uncharacterized protein LOC18443330 isoform X2 [Amborella trichopoda]